MISDKPSPDISQKWEAADNSSGGSSRDPLNGQHVVLLRDINEYTDI